MAQSGAWDGSMVAGGGVVKAERDDTPVLITEAAPSYEEEYSARKRKYITMMAMRVPCLILAGIFYGTWWLALGFVLLSVPLPWIAVLIANDRPPRKAEPVNRFHRTPRAIEAGEHKVIDG
jgi:hypothetical protein